MRKLQLCLVGVMYLVLSNQSVNGFDFGISKLAETFSTGSSHSENTTSSAANHTHTNNATTNSSSVSGSTKVDAEETATEQEEESSTPDSSNSSSWIPEAIKSPFESVAAIPNKVAESAGDAWGSVKETVVDQNPEHSVKFYLYDDPNDLTKFKQIVVGQPESLRDVRVAPDSQINVLIHGFTQDVNTSFPQKVKDGLLQHVGGPVIIVDWGHMAEGKIGSAAIRTLSYPFVVANVPKVGEYVGEMIIFLRNNSVISSYDQVHVIGFSLGGHVSGIAGWTVQNRTDGEKLGRITGLDPAGPQFFLKTKERKLNEADAKFVDVIHTSQLGYFLPLGHVDFFPNGGKIQPGCVETQEGISEAINSLGAVLSGSCSHSRAWEYYLKSIKDNDLYGCECNNLFKYEATGCETDCEDKVPFGESAPRKARGTYYLSI